MKIACLKYNLVSASPFPPGKYFYRINIPHLYRYRFHFRLIICIPFILCPFMKEKLYYGTATRADITRITRRLGDEIGKVYGWDFPQHGRQAVTVER